MPLHSQPREMAARGVHDAAFRVLQAHTGTPQGICVVDIGAGMGAFSRRLLTAGYSVLACDLYPESFRVPEITCLPVTLSGELPYAEHSADVAVALELFEHIDGHETLLNEIHRVLKPGGTLLVTTPNILNLKSRISFLMTGFLYNFPPLDPDIQDPVHQHISPFSLDRYRWRLRQQRESGYRKLQQPRRLISPAAGLAVAPEDRWSRRVPRSWRQKSCPWRPRCSVSRP